MTGPCAPWNPEPGGEEDHRAGRQVGVLSFRPDLVDDPAVGVVDDESTDGGAGSATAVVADERRPADELPARRSLLWIEDRVCRLGVPGDARGRPGREASAVRPTASRRRRRLRL
jgi:hypothetical protein